MRPQAQGAGMRGSRCCSNAVSFPAAGERLGCPHSRIAFAVCFREAGWLRQGAVAVMQVHFKVSKMVHRPLGFQQAVAKVTWLGPVAHTNKVCRRRLRWHAAASAPTDNLACLQQLAFCSWTSLIDQTWGCVACAWRRVALTLACRMASCVMAPAAPRRSAIRVWQWLRTSPPP